MTLPLKQLEGRYEILAKLQEGGMGAVYKVRHLLLDEVRVIKVIRPQFADDPSLQQRFLREARTAIRLRHPNIAQLYDFTADEEEGTSYMVMEFIDGVTLKQLLRACGPPSVPLSVEIAYQGLQALSYLHHHGFVHRDIAPDNLMLCRDFMGDPVIKLIDLGIAKRVGADAGLTQTGMFLGKVRYTSPEQLGSPGEPDHRSDLYSYGVMFYEQLTGCCPFPGDSFPELVGAHLMQPPLPFEETDAQGRVPVGLREVVLQTLEKQPDKRLASADDLMTALAPFRSARKALRDEVRQSLDATALADESAAPAEPGSTQSRLNRQFGLEPTPSKPTHLDKPVPLEPPAEPAPDAPQPAAADAPPPPALSRPPGKGDSRTIVLDHSAAGGTTAASVDQAPLHVDATLTAAEVAAQQFKKPPRAATRAAPPKRRGRAPLLVAGIVVLALAAGAGYWLWSGGLPGAQPRRATEPVAPIAEADGLAEEPPAAAPVATEGTLVLDALPWAQVRSITDAAGNPHSLGAVVHTPLRLPLPPGTYTLALTHPRLPEPRELTVTIRAGEITRETLELAPASEDAYFEKNGW